MINEKRLKVALIGLTAKLYFSHCGLSEEDAKYFANEFAKSIIKRKRKKSK